MGIKTIFRKLILLEKRKKFKNSTVIGDDVQFATSSGVVNSGSKEQIVIGHHGCMFGLLQALCDGKIIIGNDFFIGSGTVLQAKEQITIGDNVIISNNVLIVDNNNHPIEPEIRLQMTNEDDYMNSSLWSWEYSSSKPVNVEDNVWIGRDATIMKGVSIGKGSIVALKSVVTHDVPPYTIVAGNPAKVVKYLKEA